MGNACGKPRQNLAYNESFVLDVSKLDKGQILLPNSQALSMNEVSEMIEKYKEMIKENDNNGHGHLNLGICLYFIGYYEASENHLLKAKHLYKSYQSNYILGLISLKKNHVKDAQNYFNNCVIENPILCGFEKLGEVLLRRNKFSIARKIVKQGLERYTDNADLLTILGMSYLTSNLSKAYKYTKKAYKLDSSLFKPYINLAEIRKAQDKYEEAIKYYHLAIEKGNQSQKGFAQLLLASLYFEIGKLEECMSYCKESIASNPNLMEIMKRTGFDCIFIDQNIQFCIESIIKQEYEVAISNLKILYKENKMSIPVCYFLAVAYYDFGHYHKSRRFYKKIVNLTIDENFTHLTKMFLARAEVALNDINAKLVNSTPVTLDFQVKALENYEEEIEEVLTIEGNYPNFNESVKLNEVCDDMVPVANVSSETPKFFNNGKSTSLRQLASSADPDPGNCSII